MINMEKTNLTKTPDEAIVLGYGPMDEIHVEFHQLIERSTYCSDDDFPDKLDALINHLHSHFEAEDRWMAENDFPASDCHREEHAAVLRSAAEVQALPLHLRVQVGRDFARELSKWFPEHANYLDSALAAWMCHRAYGGKPIVFHAHASQPGAFL